MCSASSTLLILSLSYATGFLLPTGNQIRFQNDFLGRYQSAEACRAYRTPCSMNLAQIPFRKYQGLGNDFILVDNRATEEPLLSPTQSAKLCDRCGDFCIPSCI